MDGMDIDIVEPETDLKELMSVLTRDAKKQIKETNNEILSVIRALGGDGNRYKRERQKSIKAVISEVYSPPRVTAAIKLLHGKWVSHEEIVQRSRDEARVLGLLHHRNIVRVEDFGEEDERR